MDTQYVTAWKVYDMFEKTGQLSFEAYKELFICVDCHFCSISDTLLILYHSSEI